MTPLRLNSIRALAEDFGGTMQGRYFGWQVCVLIVALASAWWIGRVLRSKMTRRFDTSSARSLVREIGFGLSIRIVKPLLALILVTVGDYLFRLKVDMPASLLLLAATLIGAFIAIRMAVFVMRRAFGVAETFVWLERLVAIAIWIAVALYWVGVWSHVLVVLDRFALPIGRGKISLLETIRAVVSVVVTAIVALWVGSLVESRLLKTPGIDRSSRVVIARIVKALLVTLASLAGLTAVGFDLTLLSVFGGALGVGLGFGLQKIASNYVSGFIILLDKSLRLGDVIEMDKYYGVVTEIKTRYTVVKALNGTEAIVPNEMLVTNAVTNFSFTDRAVWLTTKVRVTYTEDVERAMGLLVEAAQEHPRVIESPGPRAYLSAFETDAIDLMLGFWIRDPEEGRLNITSDVNLAIWNKFRSAGIQTPYPRREVKIRRNFAQAGTKSAPYSIDD